jgi:8-hydroxy-5-deazaflavin:NADPH oxidoreductase
MKTIAVIGANTEHTRLLAALTKAGNAILLFNSCSQENLVDPVRQIDPSANIEVLDCSRDACWEADAILLLIDEKELDVVVDQIKDVATQKQLGFQGKLKEDKLRQLFPFSKLVNIDHQEFPSEEKADKESFINDQI